MEKQEYTPVVILIAGYARAGKDTVAGYLEEMIDKKYPPYTGCLEKFAAPLYDMLHAMFAETDHAFSDGLENHKNDILPYSPNGITIRKALQTLGTEWGRDIVGEGIWANLLCARINATHENYRNAGSKFNPVFIVSDNRFVSEANVVREAFSKVYTIYIQREAATPQTHHRSEQELGELEAGASFVVVNDGSLEALATELERVLKMIFA